MDKLNELKGMKHSYQLAALLGIKTSLLTYILYKLKPSTQYTSFQIPKKNGGFRVIYSPSDPLKIIQSRLSILLLDCIDQINKANKILDKDYEPTFAHGFVRKHSIITNAQMHLNQKNVLNIDLENFFDSFNFGRVRGFFIKNRNFELTPDIATIIAQIACYNNKLPQGSPCSPVITNLITHSLDIKLAALAKKHSCIYTRYADDITFSTREKLFPRVIMREEVNVYKTGKKLRNEIKRAGFSINDKKTRIQYRDSRQDVTGLVVNQKPNVKKEYWRTVKSQCHSLFRRGEFTKKTANGLGIGHINELEGQLNFIDQLDRYNRKVKNHTPLNPMYAIAKYGFNTKALLTGRERTLSQFLYYKLFYANDKPILLCEGKTDNVYLKTAVSKLSNNYPELVVIKKPLNPDEFLIQFFKYTPRTKFLLELGGGESYLNYFIEKFHKQYKFYKAPKPIHPVIIILDNDSGFNGIASKIEKTDSTVAYPLSKGKPDFRKADFIHVMHNLYLVLTPLSNGGETAIEDLFDDATRQIKVGKKSFNPKKDFDKDKEYSKEIFANKVIRAQKDTIDFSGLKPLLDRIVKAIEHYDSIK
jgi:retron-type reverse transcriptase